MLWQRVATAVVLLLLLLPALFSEAHAPLYAVALVFIAAGAWEWSRLNGYPGLPALLSGAACAIACALAWWAGWPEQRLPGLWAGAALLWLAGGAWLLRAGAASWRSRARPMRLAAGLLVLLLAWLAVAQARAVGIHFLLSVLVLVWAADICAYFTGRAWGGRWFKRRLAPTISPGKSWEGVAGAVIGVVALAWAWAQAARATSSAWLPGSASHSAAPPTFQLVKLASATPWRKARGQLGAGAIVLRRPGERRCQPLVGAGIVRVEFKPCAQVLLRRGPLLPRLGHGPAAGVAADLEIAFPLGVLGEGGGELRRLGEQHVGVDDAAILERQIAERQVGLRVAGKLEHRFFQLRPRRLQLVHAQPEHRHHHTGRG